MSKPKNMTPEQEAEWREKQAARRATPEYKAKAAIRARRYYEKPGQKEAIIENNKAARASDEGRAHRNMLERIALQQRPEKKQKAKERIQRWQATDEGKAKNREKAKRHYQEKRIEAEFDAFMRSMEGEDSHG